MDDCIFCKIATGEIQTEFIYESENVVAFKDIKPVAPVHVLFIPRKHYPTLNDMSEDELTVYAELMDAVKKTAKKLGVDQSGYRVITNVNKHAGQEVFHIHVHLIGGKPLGPMVSR